MGLSVSDQPKRTISTVEFRTRIIDSITYGRKTFTDSLKFMKTSSDESVLSTLKEAIFHTIQASRDKER